MCSKAHIYVICWFEFDQNEEKCSERCINLDRYSKIVDFFLPSSNWEIKKFGKQIMCYSTMSAKLHM